VTATITALRPTATSSAAAMQVLQQPRDQRVGHEPPQIGVGFEQPSDVLVAHEAV
jgi:hypothetical protein